MIVITKLPHGILLVWGQVRPILDAGYDCFSKEDISLDGTPHRLASKDGSTYIYRSGNSTPVKLERYLNFNVSPYGIQLLCVMKRKDWLARRDR